MTSQPTLDFLPGHDGVRIAVHRLGRGRPVLLFHGLSSNAQINWIRYGTAQRLADAGFEAIMIDQRVHGQSEAPRDPAAYPPEVMALDMAAVIPALGLGPFDLVGYSMGSRLATMMVARGLAPRKLILGGMALEGIVNWLPRRQYYLDALDRFETSKPGDDYYWAVSFMRTVKIDPVALKLLLLTMDNIPLDSLDALTMSTQILYASGDSDPASADALAAALPDATRSVIPGNHMSCITMPDFGAAMVDYLTA
jgi:pimeloyl-ACP methyl ester carboxylesterase